MTHILSHAGKACLRVRQRYGRNPHLHEHPFQHRGKVYAWATFEREPRRNADEWPRHNFRRAREIEHISDRHHRELFVRRLVRGEGHDDDALS